MKMLKSLKLPGFPEIVDFCYDAAKALKLLKNSLTRDIESGEGSSNYCLILSDINMPVMDGYQFANAAIEMMEDFGV